MVNLVQFRIAGFISFVVYKWSQPLHFMFRTGVSPLTKTMNDADTRLALPALQVLAHFGRMLLVGIIGIELNIGFSLSLSSISAILSGTIGIHYGHVLIHFKGHAERLRQWVSMGFILLIVAIILLFTDAIPINKQLYSFSYVCFTAGAAGIVFSGFYVLIDVWGLRPPFLFLEWIGMNAMLVYVMAAQGIFEGFINGWYYKSPDNTLVYWIQEHVFNDVWHSERVGTLLYVIFAQITFWAVVSGVLHKLGINWKL